jgi:hypothetical protein
MLPIDPFLYTDILKPWFHLISKLILNRDISYLKNVKATMPKRTK